MDNFPADWNSYSANGKCFQSRHFVTELYMMKVEIQNVLKRELKSRHLTINALAKECGMPVSVLHSWINGVLPSAKNLHHVAGLAKCLNLPVSILLFDKDELKPHTTILFNSEFADGQDNYRLSVEKIKREDEG